MRFLYIMCGLLLMLTACNKVEEPQRPTPSEQPSGFTAFRNVTDAVTYVGDEACFSCHEEQYLGFKEHGMARSLYRLTPENKVETFGGVTVYDANGGFYYRPFEEQGRFFLEEYRQNKDSQKTHRLVREMAYVVGSGTAARTYLDENNGRFYELPLTWYTQTDTWDFSPGYQVANKRFDRVVPDRCMACHNSYPTAVPFTNGKYSDVPLGIGCERCHGPGALHVDERLASPEPAADIDDSIVNPAHLPFERRLDVCQQCHLNTTVSILRAGRGAYDFRPSQSLQDYVAFFSVDTPQAGGEISVISHADRMKRSACFIQAQAEGKPMECVTCHDPHQGFRSAGDAYFNQTCQTCHPAAALEARLKTDTAIKQHTLSANCIACHMPKVEAEEAPHSSFTDHWIRVTEKDPPLTPLPVHDEVALHPYYAVDADGVEGGLYEGMAYVVYGQQRADPAILETGIRRLEAALADEPAMGEAQFLLGFAYVQTGRAEAALPALEEAVRLGPGIPERLNALAQAYEATGRDPIRIARLYQRALDRQPALAEIRVNYGRFLETQGRLDEALAAYQQAVAEQPWFATGHYNLGTAYLQRGDLEAGEQALKKALALDPGYAEAWGNLGLLYATQGTRDKAQEAFEAGVDAAPRNAVALGNLGAFYLNNNAPERAVEVLERAVQVDPGYVDGLANLALAYFRQDNTAQARRYAQLALDIAPENALARQVLSAL